MPVGSKRKVNPPANPWWELQGYGDAYDNQDAMVVNSAGLQCLDFTALGLQKRSAGDTDRYHSTYLGARHTCAKEEIEDFFFSEEAYNYPITEKQRRLEVTHRIVFVRAGPQAIAHPHRRSRCLGAGIRHGGRWTWIGPHSEQEIKDDFASLVGRVCVCPVRRCIPPSIR